MIPYLGETGQYLRSDKGILQVELPEFSKVDRTGRGHSSNHPHCYHSVVVANLSPVLQGTRPFADPSRGACQDRLNTLELFISGLKAFPISAILVGSTEGALLTVERCTRREIHVEVQYTSSGVCFVSGASASHHTKSPVCCYQTNPSRGVGLCPQLFCFCSRLTSHVAA